MSSKIFFQKKLRNEFWKIFICKEGDENNIDVKSAEKNFTDGKTKISDSF